MSAKHRVDFSLTPEQRADCRQALEILSGSGLSLTGAAEIAVARRKAPRRLLLPEAVREFIHSRIESGSRPKTVQWYDSMLSQFVQDHPEEHIDEIDRQQIKHWLGMRTAGSRHAYFRALSALFRWGMAQEPRCVASDPSEGLSGAMAGPRKDTGISFFTPEQSGKLLRQCEQHRAAIACTLFAGVRPEELAGYHGKTWLPWSAINEVEKMIRIPAECAKTRRARIIEGLPPTLWPWLETVQDRAATVARGLSAVIPKHGKRILGLKTWPQDVLRHTFATYAVALTGDAGKVSLWLGHEGSTALIFRHYRGLATKAEAEAFFALKP